MFSFTHSVLLAASFLYSGIVVAQKAKSFAVEGEISQPVIFAKGVISTGAYETHPAFSPSGDTLFFLKGSPDMSTWTLCFSYFRSGHWTAPEVAPFSGQYTDGDPFFTRDGKELYFVSNRPLQGNGPGRNDLDIWKVVKAGNVWSKPIHLGEPINTDKDEYYPTMTDKGTLFFGSERAGGRGLSDIYRSEVSGGSYREVQNLGDSINTADNEYEPFIASDERYLIFMATKPGGLINADLYVSLRQGNHWTRAVKLSSPISSSATEWSPKVTRDGKYFFFGSTRNTVGSGLTKRETMAELDKRIGEPGNGLGDIYQVDFSVLGIRK